MGRQKRIGILTHYYQSRNYGGVLQAYALCTAINSMGYDCEQICYQMKKKQTVPRNAVKFIKYMIREGRKRIIKSQLLIRERVFDVFSSRMIPHSERIYNSETISQSNQDYDVFVVGSDQVWNPAWYDDSFFLDFVQENKRKISYAASLGVKSLTDSQQQFFAKKLDSYYGISVREKDAVKLLQPLVKERIKWCPDPVLLLEKDQWDRLCTKTNNTEPYIFCYFLGKDGRIRKLANQFAKKRGLKIVTLPHLQQILELNDIRFGDKREYKVSPGDFISLIKNAEYVLTDSFHASVFSCLYHKQFFVFGKKGSHGMDNRIISLAEIFPFQHHFCDSDEKFCLNYLEGQEDIIYEKFSERLKEIREEGYYFLKENLRDK